jgi:hypothetical protein
MDPTRPPATASTDSRKAGLWDRLMDAITKAYDGDLQMIDSSICVFTSMPPGPKRGGDRCMAVLEAD